MGKYDALFAEDAPAKVGKYAALFEDEPEAKPAVGKYASLFEGDGPAKADLATGFDASLNLADINDSLVGGLGDTEGMQWDRATGKMIPIYRALPVAPRQKVQLDTQGVDPRQTRPEYEANIRDEGWETETDPSAVSGVVAPPDAVAPSDNALINAKRVFESSVGGGTADAIGAFLKAGRDLDDKTGGAISGLLGSAGIDARGLNEEMARWARERKSAQSYEKGVNPELEDTLLAKFAGGAGSLPPVVVASLLNPYLGAAVGGGMMAESERQQAQTAGATQEQQDTTFYANAAVGAVSEKLLGVTSLWKAAQKAGITPGAYQSLVRNIVEGGARGYGREFTQEGWEAYAANEIAKTIAGWDPTRNRTEGVLEQAAIGGLVGAPVGAVGRGASRLAGAGGRRNDTPTAEPSRPAIASAGDTRSDAYESDPISNEASPYETQSPEDSQASSQPDPNNVADEQQDDPEMRELFEALLEQRRATPAATPQAAQPATAAAPTAEAQSRYSAPRSAQEEFEPLRASRQEAAIGESIAREPNDTAPLGSSDTQRAFQTSLPRTPAATPERAANAPLPRITAAAWRDSRGNVYSGKDHGEAWGNIPNEPAFLTNEFMQVPDDKYEDGFVDASGNFLNREQARERSAQTKQYSANSILGRASGRLDAMDLLAKRDANNKNIDTRSGQPYSLPPEIRNAARPPEKFESDKSEALARFSAAVWREETRGAQRKQPQTRLERVSFDASLPADSEIRKAEAVARSQGKEVVWYRALGTHPYNGAAFGHPRFVFVNVNGTLDPVFVTAGHEVTHLMQREAPEIYRELEAVVLAQAKNRQRFDENRRGRRYEERQLNEELVADFVGESLQDPTVLTRALGGNPTLLERVQAFIRRVLEQIQNRLGRNDTPTARGAIANLRTAERALEKAWREWSQRSNPDAGDGISLKRQGDQTETEAFRRWFGDSKVVDENGEPLRVYHGTKRHGFNAFDPREGQLGSHFGTSEQANAVADSIDFQPKGAVYPVYLRLRNPLRLPDAGSWSASRLAPLLLEKGIISNTQADQWTERPDWQLSREEFQQGDAEVRQAIKAAGYDGVVYNNDTEGEGDSWIAFDPEQIKSATGNSGTFDPTNPDIRFSRQEPAPEDATAKKRAVLERLIDANIDDLLAGRMTKQDILRMARAELNPRVTSTKNAVTDREREERGIEAATQSAKREFGDVWTEMQGRIANDPDAAKRLVDSLATEPRPVSDLENAMLLQQQISLQNEYEAATAAVNRARTDFDRSEASARLERARDALQVLYDVDKLVGTETARGLNARKMMAASDYSLVRMESTYRATANDGKPLTDKQQAIIKDLHKRIAEADAKIAELEKRRKTAATPSPQRRSYFAEQARAARERLRSREAADAPSIGVQFSRQQRSLEQLRADWRKAQRDANEQNNDFSPTANARLRAAASRRFKTLASEYYRQNPGDVDGLAAFAAEPDVDTGVSEGSPQFSRQESDPIDDYAVVGAELIENGASDFDSWSQQMRNEFGPIPNLRAIFDKAQDTHQRFSREASGLESDKKRIRKDIERIKDKTARQDFSKPDKKPPRMDKEKAALLYQASQAREAYHNALLLARLKNRTKSQKVIDTANELFNTTRALMTSFDFSAVLRQGGFVVMAHPFRAAKSLGPMFRAFASRSAEFRINEEIRNRPNAPLYKAAKLFIADEREGASLTKMEEAYVSRWANKIPGVGASQRAYTTFLNKLRADSFDAMIAGLAPNGKPTVEEARAIANYVNVATGRGDMGKHATAAGLLSKIFFSPRFVLSRFQILTGQPLRSGGSFRAKRMIAGEYGRMLAGLGVVYALASWAMDDEDSIELDPRSSDFGKLRFGNTRVDIMFGLQQCAVFMARQATGVTKNAKGELRALDGQGRFEVLTRFGRTKLAPIPGGTLNYHLGENMIGEQVTLLPERWDSLDSLRRSVLIGSVAPMSMGDIIEVIEEQGANRGTAIATAAIFGASIQTFDPNEKRPKRPKQPKPADWDTAIRDFGR